jgi:hypothetical protein
MIVELEENVHKTNWSRRVSIVIQTSVVGATLGIEKITSSLQSDAGDTFA